MIEKTRMRREKLNEYLSKDFGVRQPLSQKNSSTRVNKGEMKNNDANAKPLLQGCLTLDDENSENNMLPKPSVDNEPNEEFTENNIQKPKQCKFGR